MVEKFEIMITPFQCMRTIHVYLPDNYNESQEQYPVMYMFDGHNLFFDEDATYGKSWGLKDFLDNYDKKLIIVGIECNHEGHERLNEFSPYTYENSFFGFIEGKGQQLMDWVIQELKPMIDKKYRTYPFRECSAVGGSSMGGLMALYTVIKYNQYFSKAACLSSAISMCFLQLQEDLKNSWIDSDTKVYFSFGTNETTNLAKTHVMHQFFYDQFIDRGASCYINVVQDGNHNEASWEKENPIYLDYLWK